MCICVSSASGMSETAACPQSPSADGRSALPPPSPLPSSSQYLFLPVHLMPAPVCQSYCTTTVLFKVLYCKIKNVAFIFCACFVYYLCEKYYKPITVPIYLLYVQYLLHVQYLLLTSVIHC